MTVSKHYYVITTFEYYKACQLNWNFGLECFMKIDSWSQNDVRFDLMYVNVSLALSNEI